MFHLCVDFYAPLLVTHTHIHMYMFVFFATRPCSQVNNLGHSLSQCLQIIMAFMTLVCTHLHLHMLLGALTLPPLPPSPSQLMGVRLRLWVCVSVYFRVACLLWGILFIIILFAPHAHLQQGSAHLSAFRFLRCSCFSFATLSGNAKKKQRAEH